MSAKAVGSRRLRPWMVSLVNIFDETLGEEKEDKGNEEVKFYSILSAHRHQFVCTSMIP
jgi:hypothetical protein